MGGRYRIAGLAVVWLAAGATAQKFVPAFQAPQVPWITASGESIRTVEISSGTVASVQAALDTERGAHPGAVIVLRLSSRLTVENAPLRLGSLTCAVLTGGIAAAAGSTAPSLLLIDGAERVSVSGGDFDGGGRKLSCVEVRNSGRVHLDNLRIRGCGLDGIRLEGKGNGVSTQASAITRCHVSGCGNAGIRILKASETVAMDNFLLANNEAGLHLASDHGIAHNNVVKGTFGMVVAGPLNLVFGNRVLDSETGILLAAAANNNVVLRNTLSGNALGLRADGDSNLVLENPMANATQVAAAGKDNFLVPVANAFTPPAGSARYFNPPTVLNPHGLSGIAPGRTRVDVQVSGGGSLAKAQAALDAAHAGTPSAHVVLHLAGEFTADQSLVVPSYTSILLRGGIQAAAGVLAVTGNNAQFVSFSGGHIRGGLRAFDFLGSSRQVILDSVKVSGSSADGIHFKGSSYTRLGNPVAVLRAGVDGAGRRAVWAQVLTQMIVMDGTQRGNEDDGIDLDSHTRHSYVIGNLAEDNRREGVFLEESARQNMVLANILRRNQDGINCHSENTGPTNLNLVVANVFEDNLGKGIRLMGRDPWRTDSNTFFANRVAGPAPHISVQSNTRGNWFLQNSAARHALFVAPGEFAFFHPPLAPYTAPDLPAASGGRLRQRHPGPSPRARRDRCAEAVTDGCYDLKGARLRGNAIAPGSRLLHKGGRISR